jgi:hypothetical protein
MRELLSHLLTSEGAVPYFYCDDRSLVTISIGQLVDQQGASDATGKRLAVALAQRAGIRFSKVDGTPASIADIENDWLRIKQLGRRHSPQPARFYQASAQVRMSSASMRALTEVVVRGFADQLYRNRPELLHYDARVAMAFVDVRYNPAGVALYKSTDGMQELWAALNPYAPSFDLTQAVLLFERIWAGRGPSRYGVRHYERVKWLRAGLLAMGGATAPRSV